MNLIHVILRFTLAFFRDSTTLHNELKRGKNVHFGRTMHCLPQILNQSFFQWRVPKMRPGVKKFFQKIVPLHKDTFEIFPHFSSLVHFKEVYIIYTNRSASKNMTHPNSGKIAKRQKFSNIWATLKMDRF